MDMPRDSTSVEIRLRAGRPRSRPRSYAVPFMHRRVALAALRLSLAPSDTERVGNLDRGRYNFISHLRDRARTGFIHRHVWDRSGRPCSGRDSSDHIW